jgi:hypothetical protein
VQGATLPAASPRGGEGTTPLATAASMRRQGSVPAGGVGGGGGGFENPMWREGGEGTSPPEVGGAGGRTRV